MNGGEQVKNLVFFHIPLTEYGVYWNEYKNNGHEDTANVHYVQGKAGESGEKSFPGATPSPSTSRRRRRTRTATTSRASSG